MTGRRVRLLFVLVLLFPGWHSASAQTSEDFFAPGVVRDVFLRVNSRDLEQLRATYDQNTYYPADLQWDQTLVRNVAIRSRGRASRNATKPGLRVDMDHFVDKQTFLGLDALVLDNLNQDPSMLHEHAAMALFARLGQVAPRTAFARLFLNGEYQGVYGLVEEPNENFVEQHLSADKGYLFEYHYLLPYYFDDLGEDLTPYEAHFEARTHELSSPNVLYSPLRELVRAEDGETLNEWRARVSAYMDLTQFVKMVAIEQFLSEFDGLIGHAGINNFYLYRPRGSEQHIFIPWDRDNAFRDADAEIFLRVDENRMLRQALAFPDLKSLYLDQLAQAALVSTQDDWLERFITDAAGLISPAAQTDQFTPFSEEERGIAVRELITFAKRRPFSVLNQVREAYASLP